jgi:hypothetical protein
MDGPDLAVGRDAAVGQGRDLGGDVGDRFVVGPEEFS